jgi:hypothetical protein
VSRGRWLAVAAVAVSAACAWLAIVPFDLSTVDSGGEPIDTGNRLAAILLALALGGLSVFLVVQARRDAVLPAVAVAVIVPAGLYTWRAAVARTEDGDDLAWLTTLVAFVLPLALLTSFGGAWLALRGEIVARRNRLRGRDEPPLDM